MPRNVIHRDESGPEDAPLVVFIHGSLDRSAGMARLARAVHHELRVLRYDRRGYGRSWPHDGPFTVADQVRDLQELLAGRTAVLVGHSYGGNVAIAGSIALAGQVTGVSVYETPLSWMPFWPRDTAGARSVASDPADAAEAFMRRLVGDAVWESLPAHTKEARRREGTALRGELSALYESAPWTAADISVPLVCGHGSRAAAHHVAGMKWLSEQVPGARLVSIEGAGHGAPNSHPIEFVESLVRPHFWMAGSSTS